MNSTPLATTFRSNDTALPQLHLNFRGRSFFRVKELHTGRSLHFKHVQKTGISFSEPNCSRRRNRRLFLPTMSPSSHPAAIFQFARYRGVSREVGAVAIKILSNPARKSRGKARARPDQGVHTTIDPVACMGNFLRDDNGQIYETAYRSSSKSNFRGSTGVARIPSAGHRKDPARTRAKSC